MDVSVTQLMLQQIERNIVGERSKLILYLDTSR